MPKNKMHFCKGFKNFIYGSLTAGLLTLSASALHADDSSMDKKLEAKLVQKTGLEKSDGKGGKYAFILCARGDLRHRANTSLAYNVITGEGGYEIKNVFLLDDFDSYGKKEVHEYLVDGKSDKKNVKTVFEYLSRIVDEQDTLLVYITGHGYKELSSIINLGDSMKEDENLSSNGLKKEIEKIKAKTGIFFIDICNSGGFEKSVPEEYTFISSCDSKEPGWSSSNDSFGGFFFHAFKNTPESDKNSDGKISIEEAFEYSTEHHTDSRLGRQHPMLRSKNATEIYFVDYIAHEKKIEGLRKEAEKQKAAEKAIEPVKEVKEKIVEENPLK